ncbi:MAG: protein-methionine-sulfoxide reductase heme-binding subunit MsrQ [Rhodospirillales bacterium]|nr:protein-methionine-sulfoxide reductase heme-binding subunit MsrQ [Rhodospirillales bacterium]
MKRETIIRRVVKPAVFVLCLVPLFAWVWLGLTGGLGANPIEATNRYCGEWGLRFLILGLAVTPLREITGWSVIGRFRRMIGLFAFFYVTLHLLSYVCLDQFFDMRAIWADIVKRTYITVGMAAFLLLLPLAITSTKAMVKRLGGKRWQRLHRLVYVAGILGVLHFFMMIKAGYREPMIYAVILGLLLAWRIYAYLKRRARDQAVAANS